MRLLGLLLPVVGFISAVFADDSTTPAHESTLEDYKTVTIYDSTSLDDPFELRERGNLTFSAQNRSGVFSESGVLSRPLDGASDVYRIGTEKTMSAVFDPLAIVGEDGSADETLRVHIDSTGEIFHTSYTLRKAVRAPGTFEVIVDHMDDHVGPEVVFKDSSSSKSGSAKAPQAVVLDEEGLPIIQEEEEEVPEKTFLQKYWIYAIPLLLVLVLGGGGEQT